MFEKSSERTWSTLRNGVNGFSLELVPTKDYNSGAASLHFHGILSPPNQVDGEMQEELPQIQSVFCGF